jgi:hypothetical protein
MIEKRIAIAISIMLASANLALAQSEPSGPYVRKGSIGEKKVEAPPTTDPFATLPIEKWLNQRFIFMPRRRGLQQFGYGGFSVVKIDRKGKAKYEYPGGSNIPYDKYVGRIVRVTAITKPEDQIERILHETQIELTLEDTGEKLMYQPGSDGRVEGITPVTVLDGARERYLGKTLWIDTVMNTYDSATDEKGYVAVRRYSPVRVTDVVVSIEEDAPVRFIVLAEDGKQGFVDVALSGMNARSSLLLYHRFEDAFLTEDPHVKYPWSEDIWSLIEESKVRIGMTSQQVRMSLGTPSKINTTETGSEFTEQWVYGNRRYYYFANGRLTAIQE